MSQKLTIKQIANMAGVSVAAVSYTLNGKKGVSESTRKRILDVINNTSYTPNVNSRRLILQRSFNILLVLEPKDSPLNNFFYAAIMNSIVEFGTKLGYNIVLATLSDSFESSTLETTLLQHNADGIIFLSDISSELQSGINKIGIPFIVIDSQKNIPPYPSVHADYTQASYIATQFLINNGHKKIAMIGTNSVAEYYLCTFEGYKKALTQAGLPLRPEWIQADANDELTVRKCVQNLLDGADVPTAAFCASDLVAINAMNCLQDMGYILPNDFSFCSIDDIALARYHHPSLTTIQIDKNAMGELAVGMLDDLINGKKIEPNIVVASDELIVRDSVKRIL